MQVIYVDVLLFFNFCVNYFLLRGTAFLTHTPCRIPRCLLSALLGSFSALVILLPPLPLAVNLLIRLGTAAGMNGLLCFGLSRRTMLRQTIWFFCCSMLFAGFLMFLLFSIRSPAIICGAVFFSAANDFRQHFPLLCAIIKRQAVIAMQVIYVDVLLFFNFCVNYFLLRGTAFLTHTPCRIPRCLLSALLGSFSTLVILLPPLPLAVNLLIRLGTAAGMNGLLCFGLSRRTMLRQTIWFFCCSMLFAGFLMFLQQSTNSRRIFLGNQCFYLQLSLPVCIFCTLLAYGVLRLWHAVRMRCRHTDVPYRVYIRIGSETRIQTGLADTGNNLVDPYSGLPIIVCSRQAFSDLLPQCQKKQRHYHYVPYGTVSGTSLMPVFQADEVLLQNETTGARQQVAARIGLADAQEQAIFHPNLLQTI